MNKNIDLHYNTVFERTASSNNALHLPLTDNTKHDDFSGTHAPGFLTQDIVPPSMRSNASDQVTLRSHPNQQTSQLYPSTSNVYQAQEVSQSRHKRPHQQRNTSTHHSPKHSHQTPKHKHHRTRHHSPHNTANNQLNNSTLHSTDSSSSNVYAREQQILSDRERYQIKLERTFGEYTFPPQSDKDILNTITSIMSNGKGRMDIIVEEQIIEDGVDLKQLSDLGIINNSSSDDEYGTKLDNQWKSSEKDLNQSDLLLQFKETFKPNQFNVHRDVRVYQQGHMSPNHQQILYDSKGRQVPTGFKFQTDDREISTSQSPERRHNNHHSPSNNKTQTIKNRTPDASNSLRSDGNQSINRISPQRLNYTPQYNSSPPKNKYYQKNETDNEKK
ncbi:MAG: hypothetical protein EZS28_006234 [Streblomastix strix]|uniref:Uncharacterized protein n=1 Tax=Streblomastix strix TaxID=222440 RepID=A0A5J4WSW5_9EUKA|nr:MAG: hypothetical protein EZS28_006234 [Streblomastix strix]